MVLSYNFCFVLCFAFAYGLKEQLLDNQTSNYLKDSENPCVPQPCKNDGVCTINGTDFSCDCQEPFFGKICETHPCHLNPCKNDGACIAVEKTYGCVCDEPFSGEHCEIDPCSSSPCENGGVCSVEGIDFNCSCKAPYTGKQCEYEYRTTFDYETTDTELITHVNETNSTLTDTNYTDYSTTESVTDISECDCGINSLNCHFNLRRKICECKRYYAQKNDTCRRTCNFSEGCLNGGICRKGEFGYFCNCPGTYSGDRCETDVCSGIKYKCERAGGICELYKDIGVCQCPFRRVFYKDRCTKTCMYDSDCRNGGECYNQLIDHTAEHATAKFCNCSDMYTGDMCEKDMCEHVRLGCESSGGTCKRLWGTVECQCPSGKSFLKTSGRCEDVCGYNNCVHGKCIRIRDEYKCVCDEGYIGSNCDTSLRRLPVFAAAYITLILLAIGIVIFSVSACLATCWVKKLKKQLQENAIKFANA